MWDAGEVEVIAKNGIVATRSISKVCENLSITFWSRFSILGSHGYLRGTLKQNKRK